jgi:hypothetical protein
VVNKLDPIRFGVINPPMDSKAHRQITMAISAAPCRIQKALRLRAATRNSRSTIGRKVSFTAATII